MNLRPAQVRDASALLELARTTYVAAFGHSFTPEDLVAHLARALSPERIAAMLCEDRVWVAEDGCLLGYVQLAERDAFWEVCRLYVRAEAQGHGVGSKLLETALASLAATAEVRLEVWEHNPGARHLYERYGFEVVGRRRFEVASGAETSDDLLMARRPGSTG